MQPATPEWLRRVRALFRRGHMDDELQEEIRHHLELRRQQLMDDGMDPADAHAAALRAFGNPTKFRDTSRDLWGFPAVDTILQDIRYGLRLLRKSPLFTVTAAGSIALGIAASTLVVSVVNAAVWQWSATYHDPARLVFVWQTREAQLWTPTPADFRDWRAAAKSFMSLDAYTYAALNLSDGGEPEQLAGAAVTPGLFSTLGVRPALGAWFRPTDADWGRHRRVLLSDSLWRRRFGADPSIVGRRLTLNGEPYEVSGVMPAGVWFTASRPDVFVPLAFAPDDPANSRSSHFIWAIARLADGVSLEAANAEMAVIARRIEAAHPVNKGLGARAVAMWNQVLDEPSTTLVMVASAVALVLVIACVNVAGLLLVRTVAREREIAIRASLGAGRLRVARQLLTEGVVLAFIGGIAGTAAAVLIAPQLAGALPTNLPRIRETGVPIDWRVLIFAATATIGSGALIGMLPALNSRRWKSGDPLKEAAGRSTSGNRRQLRIRGGLVAAEIAIALVLVVGASLLIRSFNGLQRSAIGVRASGLLTMRVPLSRERTRGPQAAAATAYLEQIVAGARSVPGVIAADLTSHLPLGGGGQAKHFHVVGRAAPPALDQVPIVSARQEGPDSLRAMGAHLVKGRFFNDADRASAPPVAIINMALARQFFAGEDPIGRVITLEPPAHLAPADFLEAAGGSFVHWTIVGVVDDIRYLHPSQPVGPIVHVPYRQRTRQTLMGWAPEYLVIHTERTAADVIPLVRARIREVAPHQPLADILDIESIVATAFGSARLTSASLGMFSAVALILAAIGVYGSVASAVAARTQEIGVRVALGAQPSGVVWLILRQVALLAAAGLVVGLAGSAFAGRAISTQLYGVTATDPRSLVVAVLVVAAATFAAAWLPARRAARVDPVTALRSE